MFGTKVRSLHESFISQLEDVLDRKIPFQSLDFLISAMDQKEPFEFPNRETVAIGIDASAFLKLATNKNSADIIDYLQTQHKGPIILPGQAIQEFWNNHLTAIQTLSSKLQNKLDTFKKDILDLSSDFGDFSEGMQDLVDNFKSEHGYIYDQKSVRSISSMLTALKEKACVPYVPRSRFQNIARSRKLTKTPPGFQDEGDGDFFIWVEFLYGLLKAKSEKVEFTHAILLTFDKKKDWSRGTIGHPILSAEMQLLIGVPVEFWDLDQFYKVFAPEPQKMAKSSSNIDTQTTPTEINVSE